MKIVITGSNGMLGRDLVRVLGVHHTIFTIRHNDFFVDTKRTLELFILKTNPNILIHCGAYTDVNDAESKKSLSELENSNVHLVSILCDLCKKYNISLIYPQTFLTLRDKEEVHTEFSRDYKPLGSYASSKLTAERVIKENLPEDQFMIIRLGGFYGGGEKLDKNFIGIFLNKILPKAIEGNVNTIDIGDRVWQPTWTFDIANVILFVLSQPWKSTYQYACTDSVSFSELAEMVLSILKLPQFKINKVPSSMIGDKASRPQCIIMESSKLLYDAQLVFPLRGRLEIYLLEQWKTYIKNIKN